MSQLHIVKRKGKRKVLQPVTQEQIREAVIEGKDGSIIDSQHALISMMLPPAVKAFFEEPLFWAIRDAKDMVDAKACSDALETCLFKHNKSALESYREAKDDLLAIYRLGVSSHLRKFFSSTNPIESLNSLLEEDLRRVKNWQNSDQFQRCLATSCLRNEKRMRRIPGYSGLPDLWERLQRLCNCESIPEAAPELETTSAEIA